MFRKILAAVPLLVMTAMPLAAQIDLPRASPSATVKQTVGITDVEIHYSRPGVKGREIFGGLVPWNELWRTGANEATTVEFSTDVVIADKAVPAGRYALFTIPSQNEWTVILNGKPDQTGTGQYDAAHDVARFSVKPESAPFHERMTIEFPRVQDDGATIALVWDRTRVAFDVSVPTAKLVSAAADKAIAAMEDWRTPYRAATWALDAGETANGLKWAEKSIALQPTYWNLGVKARLLAASGKTSEAIAAAEKAIAAGKKAERPVDTKDLENLVTQWKSKSR